MKILILVLGSTTLVAGGTAITSQQDASNNVTAHQRPYQEHRAASRGSDCQPVETPIFGPVAYELPIAIESCLWRNNRFAFSQPEADIDGDGLFEPHGGVCFYQPSTGKGTSYPCVKIRMVNFDPPEIIGENFLSLHPNDITYDGIDFSKIKYNCVMRCVGYLDVNGSGKPDALIEFTIDEFGENQEIKLFYVENISEWPAACATDINNDGSTNVNDLLAVVGNWGPCE